jgi:hypothetical protein
MRIALILVMAQALAAAQTAVTLEGNIYPLKSHPRLFFGYPGVNANIKDPDGAGPHVAPWAISTNPIWVQMKVTNDRFTAGAAYQNPTNRGQFQDGDLVFQSALVWYADNSQTGAHDMAVYLVTHIEQMFPLSGCEETVASCHTINYADVGNEYMAMWSLAYTLVRSELTTQQRHDFADKMLNDYSYQGNWGIGSSSGTSCTNPSTKPAGVTATIASDRVTVTTSSPMFGSGNPVQQGDWISTINAFAWRRVASITSPTVAVVDTPIRDSAPGGFPNGYGGAGSQFMYYPQTWNSSYCGMSWFMKHSNYGLTPITGDSFSAHPTYPPYGGQSTSGDYAHNLVYTQAFGHLLMYLAVIDDDLQQATRSGDELTKVYNFFQDKIWGYIEQYWSGLTPSGSGYSLNRAFHMPPSTAVGIMGSLASAPVNLVAGNWILKNLDRFLYAQLPYNTGAWMPWGQSDVAGGVFGTYYLQGLAISAFLNPASAEAQYYHYYIHNMWGSTANAAATGWTAANFISSGTCYYCGTWFTFFDPTQAGQSLSGAPLQYLFRQADQGNGMAALTSRTGWSGYADDATAKGATLTELYAYKIGSQDHVGTPGNPGSYKIVKRAPLLGEDYAPTFTSYGPQTNYIEIGGATNLIPASEAPYSNPQAADIPRANVSDSANRFAYAMADLSGAYTPSTGVTRALRHFVDFKGSGTQQFIVVYDSVATAQGKMKRTYLHYWQKAATRLSGAQVTSNNGSASELLSEILVPGGANTAAINADGTTYTGGNGATYRISMCASKDGSTCDATNLAAEFAVVHMPVDGAGNSLPPITMMEKVEANFRGVEIDGGSPKIALFPRLGRPYEEVRFTANHEGTAQILVTGLIPGTYGVRGAATLDNLKVGGDGALYFEGGPGAYEVRRYPIGGRVPKPPAR